MVNEQNLEDYLGETLFEENGVSDDNEANFISDTYTLIASVERGMRVLNGEKQRLEDFTIDGIPTSITDGNIKKHIIKYFVSNGYEEIKLQGLRPDLNFSKINQQIGVNYSYNPYGNTCLVTVLDMS